LAHENDTTAEGDAQSLQKTVSEISQKAPIDMALIAKIKTTNADETNPTTGQVRLYTKDAIFLILTLRSMRYLHIVVLTISWSASLVGF